MNQLIFYMLWLFVAFCMFLDMPEAKNRVRINKLNPPPEPNNEFKIISRSIATLKYFCIFNRSGDRVFGTKCNNKAWNSSNIGISGPVGVYVYQTEAVTEKQKKTLKQQTQL